YGNQGVEKKSSLEDLVSTFIVKTGARFKKSEGRSDNMEDHMNNMGTSIKNIKVQIGQLTSLISAQQKGSFPANTE
ncbi:hypothetical protein PanWU01x14_207010, partial [Parasponia andersonii]